MASLLFEDIREGLELVGCPHVPPSTPLLKAMLGGEGCGRMYAQIVVWVCGRLEGGVSLPASPQEEPLFRVELSSLLRGRGCPLPGPGDAASLAAPAARTAARTPSRQCL